MTEEQPGAEFYQQHKDDEDVWEAPAERPAAGRGKGRLRSTITVRFSPEEADLIRQAARRLRVSYSDIVRAAVAEFTNPHRVINPGDNVDYSVGSWYPPAPERHVDLQGPLVEREARTYSRALPR